MICKRYRLICCLLATLGGCWDEIEHQYDFTNTNDTDTADTESSADTDSDTDADMDTETDTDAGTDTDTNTDTDTDTSTGSGQGNLPEGWENFGGPCTKHEDCTGYPRARCVDTSILGIINVPGGYCTACCDSAASWCADGIQCIGLDDVYLICAATCDSNGQCRQEEGYECRQVPYLEDPGVTDDFCLPDNEHIEPDTDITPLELDCDWPWLR